MSASEIDFYEHAGKNPSEGEGRTYDWSALLNRVRESALRLNSGTRRFAREQARENPYGYLLMGALLGAGVSALRGNEVRRLARMAANSLLFHSASLLLKPTEADAPISTPSPENENLH